MNVDVVQRIPFTQFTVAHADNFAIFDGTAVPLKIIYQSSYDI